MARERWRHHMDYLTTLLGYSIASGSLVKFPYLCMRNGGGVFLLPYILFTFVGAIPCVFLEMVVGQFSQSGSINVWNMCPPLKGVGLGAVLVTWMYIICNLPVFAWFMYYFYHSFLDKLPWDNCDQSWNTPNCVADVGIRTHNRTETNVTHLAPSAVMNVTSGDSFTPVAQSMTAGEEFWRLQVLQMTDGLENIGGVRWPFVGCMAVVCVLMFLFVFKGIKVSGKVVYITVGVPFILITVFIVQGCLLPGSADGIYYFLSPKVERLLEPGIWIEACNWALFSMGIAMGNIVTMAGHNRVGNNCLRDAFLTGIFDLLFIILAVFAFFAIIGHVAYKRGVPVEAFESSGFSLAFIVYPQVVTHLPLPHVWSVLTFLALMTLEIDSLSPGLEVILGALEDAYSGVGKRRGIVVFIILLVSFMLALPGTTQGGIYIVTLVDWYVYFPAIAVFAMVECLVVSWCYGLERLNRDITAMWGKPVPQAMMLSIKYVCPLQLLVVLGYSLYSYRPPKYGDYNYPAWATGVGWMLSSMSIIPLPIIFIWTVYNAEGTSLKEKMRRSFHPNDQWRLLTYSVAGQEEVVQPINAL